MLLAQTGFIMEINLLDKVLDAVAENQGRDITISDISKTTKANVMDIQLLVLGLKLGRLVNYTEETYDGCGYDRILHNVRVL